MHQVANHTGISTRSSKAGKAAQPAPASVKPTTLQLAAQAPAQLQVDELATLSADLGNQAVNSLIRSGAEPSSEAAISSPIIQPKRAAELMAPVAQRMATVNINDDPKLEREADVMGQKALSFSPRTNSHAVPSAEQASQPSQIQRRTAGPASISEPISQKPNNTSLPDRLKTGMESMSGVSLDDVNVHYNSPKPAQLQAHAYAQGSDIHMAPGQEKHLAHEAWHVVQQKQGRVKPTVQMKEADELGMSPEAWQTFLAGQKQSISDETDALEAGTFGSHAGESPQSLQELAQNAAKFYTYWRASDDILLDILLGPFEANWFKAKACLTMDQWPSSVQQPPAHDVGIKLMQALVDMRDRKWKAFTDRIKPEFKERMRMYGQIPQDDAGDGGSPILAPSDVDLQSDVDDQLMRELDPLHSLGRNVQEIYGGVGAMAVTSDVDQASGGSNSELGIQFVNSQFRLNFLSGRKIPYDPGTVFDINVYASDWIHGEAKVDDQGGVRTITPGAEVQGMSAQAEKERTQRLEVWSLVKVRRNMNDKEWASYMAMTLNSITDDNARREMEAKLLDADSKHAVFRERVETKQKAIEARLGALAAEEEKFLGRASAFGHENQEYQQEADEMRASNAIYEETLTEVKLLRVKLNQLNAAPRTLDTQEALNQLGIQLADKIAESLTYANEVYATEGAVQHTVLKQGASKKLKKLQSKPETAHLTDLQYNLKPELYLQAVNENVGDSLHSINHYKHVPHYAVYRAGKYLARLIDAADQLLGPQAQNAHFYSDLKQIGENAVRVKATEIAGIEGDPKFVEQDQFFKDYNPSNLSTVREEIIKFGATIPQLFNENKRAAKEREQNASWESLTSFLAGL